MTTIRDVAKLAGVGLGTASRVVSGKGSVAPATAEKVRRAIEALDFRPSHAARALLSGSTQMIGVYIPLLKGSFYPHILQTIDRELRTANRHMVVAFGREDTDTRHEVLEGARFLMERDCDGIVLMSNALTADDAQTLLRRQPNLVILNSSFESVAARCFLADHVQGGRLAAQTLLRHGHRRLVAISGPLTSPDNVDRMQGFIQELRTSLGAQVVIPCEEADFSTAGGYAAAGRLLDQGHRFTALFCANDEMAVGALACLAERGLRVPRDVSVLGYDDTPAAEFAVPRLSSVHMPIREVTLAGTRALLNQCYGLDLFVDRHFPVSITARASVIDAT